MINPFRIHGVVTRPDFTDREMEVSRIRAALAEPGAKLLVYGERRMGKTSALRVAGEEHSAAGGLGMLADFSTATNHADLANRILTAATRALGRRWKDIAQSLAGRMGVGLEISVDPATGMPTASLTFGARDANPIEQRDTLARVLDSLEAACAERDVSLGVVLDEFQEITRLGGEEAEWHLRGVIQHHQRLAYVVAGSRVHIIRRMTSQGGAFYKLFDVLPFGPMEESGFAGWIDERMQAVGIGAAIIRLAGPRTRDAIQLARKAYDLMDREHAKFDIEGLVNSAFVEVVHDESDPLQLLWSGYSAVQANVLRAIATGTESLTTADSLRQFGLRSSAAATQAAATLVERGVLVQRSPGEYHFDSPFQRGWVIMRALPDIGIALPPTHIR